MLNKFYKLRDSVDVYYLNLDNDVCEIEFYKINTRERLKIRIADDARKFIAKLDGDKSLKTLCKEQNLEPKSLIKLTKFLLKNKIIKEIEIEKEFSKFERQINFFDDLILEFDGNKSQEIIENKKVVLFGVGSVGGDIIILLARMGIKNFVLIDYKKLKFSDKIRHLYCNDENIGEYKTQALKNYMIKIDDKLNISCINEKLLPYSNLDKFIPSDTDIVINSADEPYIGHTSLKLGRYLWDKNIAMYVAGGFDAHSMSTGEIIVPKFTSCIDCYQNSFKVALKDWKPTYPKIENQLQNNKSMIVAGGAGSLAACSLFSASYAVMCIVYYFLGLKFDMQRRGEYLINQGNMTWIELGKTNNEKCKICGR